MDNKGNISTTIRTYGGLLVLCFLIHNIQANNSSTCFDVESEPSWSSVARRNACGVSKAHHPILDRIMGGNNADLGEFPWMARLFYRSKKHTEAMCGGSLIHEQYILTAAHCCNGDFSMELFSGRRGDYAPSCYYATPDYATHVRLFVRLGEYDTLTDRDCHRGYCAPKHVDISVDRIITHEEYNPKEFVNDICLVKLSKKVKFTDYVYPICLPTYCKMQENKFEHATLTAAGWGVRDDIPDRQVDVLQKLTLKTVPKKTCQTMWREEGLGMEIGDNQICAGKKVGQDVCGGDSGGPLMYKSSISKHARQYVVGLVSFGQPCSQRIDSMMPGVYTNVAHYLPWIFDNIA